MKGIIATAALTLTLLGSFAAGASAQTPSLASAESGDGIVSPNALCQGGLTVYRASNNSVTFTRATGANASVTGGPGVTLAISTSTTYSVAGAITTTAEVSASNVIVSVKASVGQTITTTRTGTTTNSGSWTVPTTWAIGRLEIGANKYYGTVTRYTEARNCSLTKVGSSATYNAPAQEWHFRTSRVS